MPRPLILLLALVSFILLSPFLLENIFGQLVLGVVGSATFFIVIYATDFSKKELVFPGILAVAALVTTWGCYGKPEPGLIVLNDATIVALFVYCGYVLLIKRVFRCQHIDIGTLLNAISVYLLIGLIWAHLYHALEAVHPGSIVKLGSGESIVLLGDFVYYSYVTLTTLGYGDILPATMPAKALAMLEAVVGVFYIAVLISRLIAMYGIRSK